MSLLLNSSDIAALPQRYRATFINSLGGFRTVALIGTRSRSGATNLAIFNSLFHVGANPPLFGFIVRPDSVDRHTLQNILEVGQFTVNQVTSAFYESAHQTSARYPADVSEFTATNLTEHYEPGIYPPFVAQSPVRWAAAFRQKIDIERNGTIMILAEITKLQLPQDIVAEDGYVDLAKAGVITCNGLDAYHTPQSLARLSYAKPDTWPVKLGNNE